MRQGESDIKHGVAPVNDFVIKENELPSVDENILGAVVTMDQSLARGASFRDQVPEKRGCRRDRFRRVGIKGFQPELLEVSRVSKNHLQASGRKSGSPVNGAEQLAELADVIRLDDSVEKKRFPVGMRLRDRTHSQEMMFWILENEGRDGSWRGKSAKPLHAQGFPVDTFRTAKPGRRNPKLFESLLQHPGLASRS